MTQDIFFRDTITETLARFTPPKDSTDIVGPNTPSAIQVLNESRVLPDVVGGGGGTEGSISFTAASVKSIFDPLLMSYINKLPYNERDAAYKYFDPSTVHFAAPIVNAKEGQSGWVGGLLKDIAGEGLGIVNEAFKILDLASATTEQALGFMWSWTTQGFGADLSLAERWEAGKLFYEGLEKDVSWKRALELATYDDAAFEQYVKDNEGGLIDVGLRMALDPLWLLGGIPKLATAPLRIAKVAPLVKTADFLAAGLNTAPLFKWTESARLGSLGPLIKNALRPLALIGVSTEQRLVTRTIEQTGMHAVVERSILETQLRQHTVGNVGFPGLLRNAFRQSPQYRAEETANNLTKLLLLETANQPSPQALKATLDDWRKGINQPIALQTRATGEAQFLLERLDLDNFRSLQGKSPAWITVGGRQQPLKWQDDFIREVNFGAGAPITDPVNDLLTRSRSLYGVESTGPLQRLTAAQRYLLGATLLNSPGYVVLNIMNNMFTAAFDHDVVQALTTKNKTAINKMFGGKFDDVLGNVASGSEWMARELGFVRGQKHIWDNRAVNFGVRTAASIDNMARMQSGRAGLLKGVHYLDRWEKQGGFFENPPDEIMNLIPGVRPTQLIDERAAIESGEAFQWFSLRKIREGLFADIADPKARLAAQDTLETHLPGMVAQLDDEILAAGGDIAVMNTAIDRSRAEMQMYKAQTERLSKLGVHSSPVEMKSLFDAVPRDFAVMSDEWTMWTSQHGLMLDATGSVTPLARGQIQYRMNRVFADYMEQRNSLLQEYVDGVRGANIRAAASNTVRATDAQLPRDLAGAKPRYRQFDLEFESDLDKAAYITAQTTRSRRDADYLAFVKRETGWSDSEIRAYGREVRDSMRDLQAVDKVLTVPAGEAVKDLGRVISQPQTVKATETSAKQAVDQLEQQTRIFRNKLKAEIDTVVNNLVKVDINQAKMFDASAKRMLDSFGTPEDAFRAALRRTYHPSRLDEKAAFDAVSQAMDARANDVRGLFSANVNDFKFGSFAPPPVLSDSPMISDRFKTYATTWDSYTTHMKANVSRISDETDRLRREVDVKQLLDFVDTKIVPHRTDYDFALAHHAKLHADMTMLDYGHQMGIDQVLKMVFPYEFWPTRTAWHWAQRGLAKPGAVQSLYYVAEAQEEWQAQVNEKYLSQIEAQLADVNISPEVRLDLEGQLANRQALAARMNKLTIPMPFLNQLLDKFGLESTFNEANLFGIKGLEIAFDPYDALFPVLNWSKDYNSFDPEPTNWLGRQFQAIGGFGLAPNPLAKSALSLTGVLPEREDAFNWMRNTGSPALIATGVGPVGQAVYRWYSLGDHGLMDKLSDAIGVDIGEFFFEHGYGPQGLLNYLAAEITGTDPRDPKNFELYNVSRSLSAQAATDTRLLALEDERKRRIANGENPATVHEDINSRREAVTIEYVKAYWEVAKPDGSVDADNPLLQRARAYAATESGLRDVTRWLFGMGGVNVWEPGETIQKGLEFLYDATNRQGDADQRKAFYQFYPEFTPRKIMGKVLNDSEEAWNVSREALYFYEQSLIEKTFDLQTDPLSKDISEVYDAIRALEARGLDNRGVRAQRGALFDSIDPMQAQLSELYDQKNEAYRQLEATYGRPRNSTAKNPWDRALDNYKDEWYAIGRIDDKEQRDAAKEDFLARFPPAGTTNQYLTWMDMGARASAIRMQTLQASYDKSNEETRLLRESRDQAIEELTLEAARFVNARDIRTAIGLTERGPISPQLAEYYQASTLMTQYMGFEHLGLSPEDKRAQKKAFWDAHPILEKYYGLESYYGTKDYAIQSSLQQWYAIWENSPDAGEPGRREYLDAHSKEIEQLRAILEPGGLINPQDPNSVRLGDLWDGYFKLPEKSQARRDYLSANSAEIDKLNLALGKDPLSKSQSSQDIARESQLWEHYFSLPKGDGRTAFLIMVKDELNEIRRRLGKEPLSNVGFVNPNPRLSDSAPVTNYDLERLLR